MKWIGSNFETNSERQVSMRKITPHVRSARRSVIAAALGIVAINACTGGEPNMFRHPIPRDGLIEGELRINKAETYSIAIEAVVASSIQDARQHAWNYLSMPDASAPLEVTVAIQGQDGIPIFRRDAVDPKLSSWSTKKLYLEVARIQLLPGHYRVHATQTGKNLSLQSSFEANLVIVPAYQGK